PPSRYATVPWDVLRNRSIITPRSGEAKTADAALPALRHEPGVAALHAARAGRYAADRRGIRRPELSPCERPADTVPGGSGPWSPGHIAGDHARPADRRGPGRAGAAS